MYESQAGKQLGILLPYAALAPFACVLHCLGAPLFVLAAPALAENRGIEWTLMAIAATLGIGTVLSAARRHGDRRVWVPVGAGLLIWLLGLSGWWETVPETPLTVAGGLLLAAGMLWNARLRHRHACAACGCPVHE